MLTGVLKNPRTCGKIDVETKRSAGKHLVQKMAWWRTVQGKENQEQTPNEPSPGDRVSSADGRQRGKPGGCVGFPVRRCVEQNASMNASRTLARALC